MPILKLISRWVLAPLFIGAGILHFWHDKFFIRIVPPMFPAPRALVYISGLCEIAGGLGILIPKLRRPAGRGLVALLVAVFPANIYMAAHAERFADAGKPWMLWARLPLQIPLIAWVWWCTCAEPKHAQIP